VTRADGASAEPYAEDPHTSTPTPRRASSSSSSSSRVHSSSTTTDATPTDVPDVPDVSDVRARIATANATPGASTNTMTTNGRFGALESRRRRVVGAHDFIDHRVPSSSVYSYDYVQ